MTVRGRVAEECADLVGLGLYDKRERREDKMRKSPRNFFDQMYGTYHLLYIPRTFEKKI